MKKPPDIQYSRITNNEKKYASVFLDDTSKKLNKMFSMAVPFHIRDVDLLCYCRLNLVQYRNLVYLTEIYKITV